MPEEKFEQPNDPISLGSSDSEAGEPGSPETRNRPAEGARIATPDDVLGGTLGASLGEANSAGDFLGLDTELTGAMADSGLELSQAPTVAAQAESELEQGENSSPSDLMASPGPLGEVESSDSLEGGQGSFEGAEGEFDAEFDEEYEAEYDEEFDEEAGVNAPSGLSKLQLVGAFAGGLVVVFGVTMGPKLFSAKPAPALVSKISNVQQPAPRNSELPGATAVVDAVPDSALADAGAEALLADSVKGASGAASGGSMEAPVEMAQSEPVEFQPDSSGTPGSDVFAEIADSGIEGAEALRPEVLGFQSDPLAQLNEGGEPGRASIAGLEAGFPDFTTGFDWATRGSLDMVWREKSIPMEAIHAPARTMMPFVGMVRATLTNGASLDGKLHALGEGSVWLRDTSNGGLLGLDGNLVSKLEHLAVEAGLPLAHAGSGSTSLSTQVRVKLPGGVVAGTILAREGDWVSIRLASGGVIQLQNPELEEVTQDRVILIRD